MVIKTCAITILTAALAFAAQAEDGPARQMEALSRGLTAIHQGGGDVFVSWRLFGDDPSGVAFNLYRQEGGGAPVRLNDAPLDGPTHFQDTGVDFTDPVAYTVRPVVEGEELASCRPFELPAGAPAEPYLSVPVQTPEGYHPNDISVGDLDGDGDYELIVHMVGRGRDNAHSGMTTEPILHAYKLDGTLLWEINLGRNIREGAHYTQFMVYDLDGNGRAEIVCKTADGTVDGVGNVIGDADADHRAENGYILAGPEFLTVFGGETGEALATVNYVPPRHPETRNPTSDQLNEVWGDGYGNRVDRFLACVAYLDGERPSVVMARGYYTRTVLAAWNWRDGELSRVWTFDTASEPELAAYEGQGNHQLAVADVTGDGRDAIIYGAAVIDHDGTGLYSTGWGHGDALHVSQMDPDRPGFQIFMPHEYPDQYGPNAISYRDAETGDLIWGVEGTGDIGRGAAMDIDPRYPGYEMWASGDTGGLYTAQQWTEDEELGPRGVEISENKPRAINFGVWWTGDLLRETLDGTTIAKWNWEAETTDVILSPSGVRSINGTKATPNLSADILGDWREEVIWRSEDNQELRIYMTVEPTEHRFHTLMHDPVYRMSVAWQNVAYNQPPHPGFYLGHHMDPPPRPNIYTVEAE